MPGFVGSSLPGFVGSSLPGFVGSSLPGFVGSSLPGFFGSSLPGFVGSSLPGFSGSGFTGGIGHTFLVPISIILSCFSVIVFVSLETSLLFSILTVVSVLPGLPSWITLVFPASRFGFSLMMMS